MKLTLTITLVSSGIGNNFLNTIGTNTHVITALNTSIPEISGEIVPNCSAILAAAITRESVDVNKNADEIVVFISYHFPIILTGINFEIKKAINNKGMISNKPGSFIKEGMFKFTPTMIKNIGMKNPYPNESNFSIIS